MASFFLGDLVVIYTKLSKFRLQLPAVRGAI
jgi:hypothetical protein